ncbi:MAG TPA: hypothetical protein VGQ83_14615 [Polyangia bacterium]|jgi:hypothetical protein
MKKLGIAALVARMALMLGGCGHEPPLDPASVNEVYGGLTTSDEQPMFGEETVYESLGMAAAEPIIADPAMTLAEYQAADQAAPRAHYFFLLWGNLKLAPPEGAADAVAPKDFSGSLTLSAGAVGVLRKVRFDAAQGDGVLPRTDAAVVDWQSTIYDRVDGLLFKIVAPEDATVTVAFAGGLTITKAVSELDLAHGVVPVPGGDDAIAWAAAALPKDPAAGCAHGYLVGRWHPRAAIGGLFRGKWVSADGQLHGHLRGLYGERRDGDHVFFGKWIGGGGLFQGLLAGRYADGELTGHWLDQDLALRGRINGLYFEPSEISLRKIGFFVGTWHEACAAEPLAPSETEVR